jgi:hypothetical protein
MKKITVLIKSAGDIDKRSLTFEPCEEGVQKALQKGETVAYLFDSGKFTAESVKKYLADNGQEVDGVSVPEEISIALRAVPSHSPAKAESETEWNSEEAVESLRKWASSDGSGDQETINFGKYATGFACYDGNAAGDVESYRLPHQAIEKGQLTVVLKGLDAAAAEIQAAEGGEDYTPEVLAKAKAHLERHYTEFDKVAPWNEAAPEETPIEKRKLDLESTLIARFKEWVGWHTPEAKQVFFDESSGSLSGVFETEDGDYLFEFTEKTSEGGYSYYSLSSLRAAAIPGGEAIATTWKKELDDGTVDDGETEDASDDDEGAE